MSEKVFGVYTLCNTASVLIHEIDTVECKVLASINNKAHEWCDIDYCDYNDSGTEEPGFYYADMFIPFCEVMKYDENVFPKKPTLEECIEKLETLIKSAELGEFDLIASLRLDEAKVIVNELKKVKDHA